MTILQQHGNRIVERAGDEGDRCGFAVARVVKRDEGIYENSLQGRLYLQ
jgi:hypothetical protein